MNRLLKVISTIILLAALSLQIDIGEKTSVQIKAAYAQASGTAITISWTPPTTYTDGYPLLEQELDYYTFYCNNTPLKTIDVIIGTWTDVVDTSGLPSGDYTCDLSVTSLLGVESDRSVSTVNFTIGARKPGMVTGLTLSP